MTPDARDPAQPSSGGLRGPLPRALGPRLVESAIRGVLVAAEALDGVLDAIPSYEGGKWYRRGYWGCRMGLYRFFWTRLDGTLPKPPSPEEMAKQELRRMDSDEG